MGPALPNRPRIDFENETEPRYDFSEQIRAFLVLPAHVRHMPHAPTRLLEADTVTNTSTQTPRDALAKCLLLSVLLSTASLSQNKSFHHAPASARTDKNPYSGQNLSEGKAAFELNCAACHGPAGEGSGNIPSLSGGEAQGAGDGELFWYITKGDVNNGMPAWRSLSEEQRWEIVNYLRVLGASKPGSPRIPLSSEEAITMGINAPPPRAPFTDYRFEKPGTSRKITLEDLPAPLEQLRLEAARIMIEGSRHPVEVVASETGFVDSERMRRAFLRAFGQPPQAVRRNAVSELPQA